MATQYGLERYRTSMSPQPNIYDPYMRGLKSNLRGTQSAINQQAGNARALSGASRGLLSQFQSAFAPVNSRIAETAEIPLSVYENQAATDVAAAFDRARGIRERELTRMGINPNSGRFQGSQRQMLMDETAKRAGAITAARNYGREANFQRLTNAANIGQGLLGRGLSGLSQAASINANVANQRSGLASQMYGLANDAAYYQEYEPQEIAPAVQQNMVAAATPMVTLSNGNVVPLQPQQGWLGPGLVLGNAGPADTGFSLSGTYEPDLLYSPGQQPAHSSGLTLGNAKGTPPVNDAVNAEIDVYLGLF